MNDPTIELYTAKVRATGDRNGGIVRTSDGMLDLRFSVSGHPDIGTNCKQLFAVSWSACLIDALVAEAEKKKIKLRPELGVNAEIDFCQKPGAQLLRARFEVGLGGIERSVAQAIVNEVLEMCPYSKTVAHGNMKVEITLAQRN